MRYLIGTTALLAAGWLLYVSRRQWREVIDAIAARSGPPPETQMSAFGEIMRPILLFALVYVGAKTTFVFFWFEATRYLSLFDLAGFWLLLIAYGSYITVKTKYPRTLLDRADDRSEPAADALAESRIEESARAA